MSALVTVFLVTTFVTADLGVVGFSGFNESALFGFFFGFGLAFSTLAFEGSVFCGFFGFSRLFCFWGFTAAF